MDCERTRTAISARLDGEDVGAPAEAVRTHLAACVECRAYQEAVASLHARVRVAPAPRVPDLTARILGAIGADDGAASPHLEAWRIGLGFVAIVQIGLAVPALLLGSDAGLPVHTARHLGSFAVALAVGFLFAAWRPSRVAGLFPVAAALVACLVITSVIDIATGRAAAVNELTHVTELLGLGLLWLVGRAAPADRSTVPTIVPGPA
ncbi:MAG: zf-HC2 domain-containing protein [Acidimicrobiia bacterium]|nr:zf-HC2 domain-containing protein [Acidimicrobiia bacterium]